MQVKNFKIDIKSYANGSFSGYASVFNVIDLYNDIILPGSFGKFDPAKIPLLFEHRPNYVIGCFSYIQEDQYGLCVEGWVKDGCIRDAFEAKAIDGLSIGYKALQTYADSVTGTRYIGRIYLYEISLVENPANLYARATPTL